MTSTLTLKLTSKELDILDWLISKKQMESRSQALRFSLLEVAKQQGLKLTEFAEVQELRSVHLPRRSAKLVKLVGARRKQEIQEQAKI